MGELMEALSVLTFSQNYVECLLKISSSTLTTSELQSRIEIEIWASKSRLSDD